MTGAQIRRWWLRRVGRRGEFLLFLALLDVLYGLSLARPAATPAPTVCFLVEVLPLPLWAALWWLVAGVCLIGAFRGGDRLAYAAAAALKVLWGGMFLIGWIAGEIERGWVAAVIWLAFAVFVVRNASRREPAAG